MIILSNFCRYSILCHTPTASKPYKIFTILGFNNKQLKTKLCMISIILNENYETLYAIFNYLQINFNFYPKFIIIYFNKSCFKAILKFFAHTKIIPCYYHLMEGRYKKLKLLKNKNKKKEALDLISNNKNNVLLKMLKFKLIMNLIYLIILNFIPIIY